MKKNLLAKIFASVVMAAAVLLPIGLSHADSSCVRDTGTNSIMYHGACSLGEFDGKLAHGDGLHSASELQQVYGSWGVNASTMNGTVLGEVTKSGDVIVGGKVVATGAKSVGRTFETGSVRDPKSGLWLRSTSISFRSSELGAFVNMSGGTFHWAVLTACGNLVTAHPVQPPKPSVQCISLKASTTHGVIPLAIKFTAKATAKNTKIDSYVFKFGDGSQTEVRTNPEITHVYRIAGDYTATVQLRFVNGTTGITKDCSVCLHITKPPKPTFQCISLTADKAEGNLPLKVNFTAKATAKNTKIQSYIFNFGDESAVLTTDKPTASHTYLAAGSYTATVQVKTDAGTTEISYNCSTSISVTTPPSFQCISLSATPTKGDLPLKVNFVTVASATGTTIESYLFNYGDGQTQVSADANTSHTYTTAGNYVATVQVKTDAGTTAISDACSATINVTKSNQCISLMANPDHGKVPLTVNFTAVGSAKNTDIQSYIFNFGDGGSNVELPTATTSHVYTKPGTYTATVQIKTAAGTTAVTSACTAMIKVAGGQGSSFQCKDLTADTTDGDAPLAVNFTATGKVKNAKIESYLFDFGDGVTQESKDATVAHTYTQAGDFSASVKIKTNKGITESDNNCVAVIHVSTPETPPVTPPAQIPDTGPEAAFLGMGGTGALGYAVRAWRRSKQAVKSALLK